jgi:photosynthetic reaction center cytochrome c subunit
MNRILQSTLVLAGTAAVILLSGCGERPPIDAVQTGFRGTGMEQIYNPRLLAKEAALNKAPDALAPAAAEGPRAKDVYQNVKVLGDLSVGEFTRHMVAITQWVAPKEGCNYCHNPQNLADDSVYTKVVARRMIQMTQHLNANWQKHVGATGVTCYTCHRGNPVPTQVWYQAPDPRKYAKNSLLGDLAGQNTPSVAAVYSSLPYDPFTPYLKEDKPIRVNGTTALTIDGPGANRASSKQAEHTYSLMMHMSDSLGVNCTYCHNTRAFQSWSEAPPQRVTAWHGIRMARDLNNAYIEPLTSVHPANRIGPMGDIGKVNCATCHQGAYKPLYGAKMAESHPELLKVMLTTPKAEAAPAAPNPEARADFAMMFFAVNSAVLEGVQAQKMAELIQTMKSKPEAKAVISGYHSASGTLAQNQELAKQRAFTVRDNLVAAGIATDRIVLQKPVMVQANVAGEDQGSRRVEVLVQ